MIPVYFSLLILEQSQHAAKQIVTVVSLKESLVNTSFPLIVRWRQIDEMSLNEKDQGTVVCVDGVLYCLVSCRGTPCSACGRYAGTFPRCLSGFHSDSTPALIPLEDLL